MTVIPPMGTTAELRGGRRDARSAVLVLHGGQEHNSAPTSQRQLSYLRMLDMYAGLRRAARHCAVYLLRHGVRGWNAINGAGAPVAEAWDALETITTRHPGAPVALLGHSMGGRTAFAVAGHPGVVGVCALAPWLPESEPLPTFGPSAHFVLAHGTGDRTTSPLLSLQYADRLQARGATVARFELEPGDHALLRSAPLWHRFAVRTTLGLVGNRQLPAGVAAALHEGSLNVPLADFD